MWLKLERRKKKGERGFVLAMKRTAKDGARPPVCESTAVHSGLASDENRPGGAKKAKTSPAGWLGEFAEVLLALTLRLQRDGFGSDEVVTALMSPVFASVLRNALDTLENTMRLRRGTVEMVKSRVGEKRSGDVVRAGRLLSRTTDVLRCDYVMSLCEELGVDAQFEYNIGRDLRINLLEPTHCRAALARVLDSPRGGLQLLRRYGEYRECDDFFAATAPDLDPSVFNRVMREARAVGDEIVLSSMQDGALLCPCPSVLEWMVRDGLYDPRLTRDDAICHSPLALHMLLAEGNDPNTLSMDSIQPLCGSWVNAEMVDLLVAAGAEVDQLEYRRTPNQVALRRMLELLPREK